MRLISYLVILFSITACIPSNHITLDILKPAEYTLSDTGKVIILNASYLPSVIETGSDLLSQMTDLEQYIFDTAIINHLFDGFFSILNVSPVMKLRDAEYYELRTTDTANFLKPLNPEEVSDICKDFNAGYLVVLEYYSYNGNRDQSLLNSGDWWNIYLTINFETFWRIYSYHGTVYQEFNKSDSLIWNSNESQYQEVPELIDGVRESFFYAGENFGKKLSPYWDQADRVYYSIYNKNGEISLNKDDLSGILKSAGNNQRKYKACFNLAVLYESEDKLTESLSWLKKAEDFKMSQWSELYKHQLEKRLKEENEIIKQIGTIN